MSRDFAYFVIYWMSTAISGKDIRLSTTEEVTVKCWDPIVLQCAINSTEPVSVIGMKWGNFCTHSTPRPQCDYIENKSLTYTILHAEPTHAQTYTCTLQANKGHGMARSIVKVVGCDVQILTNIQAEHVQCSFSGVYPEGTVHWFSGNENMTHQAFNHSVNSEKNGTTDGLFNISSTLPIQAGVDDYNCSLWIPSKNGYITSHKIVKPTNNGQCSPNKNKLSLILLVLGFILSKARWEM